MDMAAALSRVQSSIHDACRKAGRDPASVTLIAVSKKQPLEKVIEAYDLGVRDFGENHVQELAAKVEAMRQSGRFARWHLIGRLQRNKINTALRYADVIHTIDTPELRDALIKRVSDKELDVFVQVNIGNEAQKGGVDPDKAVAFAESVAQCPGLRLLGLMAVPPAEESPLSYFEHMQQLSNELVTRLKNPNVGQLSMGMSHDFADAVSFGATCVRVGTAIFGTRPAAQEQV